MLCWSVSFRMDVYPRTFWQVLDQLKTVPLIPDAAGLLPNRRFTGFHTA